MGPSSLGRHSQALPVSHSTDGDSGSGGNTHDYIISYTLW